ncbi:unnamed protein product [Ectocarpus sp. 4 AP-2014]
MLGERGRCCTVWRGVNDDWCSSTPGVFTMLKYAAEVVSCAIHRLLAVVFLLFFFDMYRSGSMFAQSGLQTRRGTSVSRTIIIIARGVSCVARRWSGRSLLRNPARANETPT